jgi:hypothetical protein
MAFNELVHNFKLFCFISIHLLVLRKFLVSGILFFFPLGVVCMIKGKKRSVCKYKVEIRFVMMGTFYFVGFFDFFF